MFVCTHVYMCVYKIWFQCSWKRSTLVYTGEILRASLRALLAIFQISNTGRFERLFTMTNPYRGSYLWAAGYSGGGGAGEHAVERPRAAFCECALLDSWYVHTRVWACSDDLAERVNITDKLQQGVRLSALAHAMILCAILPCLKAILILVFLSYWPPESPAVGKSGVE